MDYRLPFGPDDAHFTANRPRRPLSSWLLVALIGIVLGGASLAAAVTTDTRDFAARHHSVLASHVL